MSLVPYAQPQFSRCLLLATALDFVAVPGIFGWAMGWWGVVGLVAGVAVMVLGSLFVGWVVWFFRNPERVVPDTPDVLVAPADGVVTHVDRVESISVEADGSTPTTHPFMPGPAQRVSIFLSVFNVHANRAPLAGTVALRDYRRGEFFDARSEESHGKNERMDLGLVPDDPDAPRCVVRQLSGLIARRIVCEAEPGTKLARGEMYGMIKFGSRTSLFVPADAKVEWQVRVGDKVKAGETVLGVIRR